MIDFHEHLDTVSVSIPSSLNQKLTEYVKTINGNNTFDVNLGYIVEKALRKFLVEAKEKKRDCKLCKDDRVEAKRLEFYLKGISSADIEKYLTIKRRYPDLIDNL